MNVSQIAHGSASRRFTKGDRIRQRAEFQQVFATGTRLHGRYFTAVLLSSDRKRPRLGLVTSRKFGDAVQRNRAKRLIREMFRQQLPTATDFGADLVIIPRREMLDAPFARVLDDFQNLWRRAAARFSNSNRS